MRRNVFITIVSILMLVCLFAFARTTTTDLGLVKPTWDENVDILGDINANTDIIEEFANDPLEFDTGERVEDRVGAMWTGNTETFITLTYQDGDNTIDAIVPVLDEDNMSSDSATYLATQQSIKAYADTLHALQYLKTQVDTLPECETIWGLDVTTSTELTSALTLYYLKTAIDTETEMETIWGVGLAHSGANSDITSMTGLTTALAANYGGTGVLNNAAETITMVGDDAITFTTSAATSITLPTSGTLATTSQLHTQNTDTALGIQTTDIVFEGSVADEFETTFLITNPTADRVITFPNSDQTLDLSLYYLKTAIDTQAEMEAIWVVDLANAGDLHAATTVTTTNGLSISGQEISLGTASTNTHGALTDTDWNTFDGKQAALTFGIADTNKVQINAADVADNDYAKFTSTGLEGRSYAEVLGDIGAAAGYDNLTEFVDQTAWRVFYSNTDGDVVELALGASGTFLKSNGESAAPTFAAAGGANTAWDDITDPDADGSVAFAGFEQTLTSTLDEAAHTVLTITDTDADLANAVTLLKLTYTDDGQANGTFIDLLDNASGDSKFSVGVNGNTLIAGTLGVTGTITGTLGTAAQANITSVGTLTSLVVDNITINTNDISSTAGTDLTITPLAGEQIVLDATVVVDAGVITGITSVTADNIVNNTGILPDANDGAYIGAAGTAFQDLFLAEGGVINWDSSDFTITQTGNVLNFDGGEIDFNANSVGFTLQTLTGDGTDDIDWKLGNYMSFTCPAGAETFTFTAPSNPCGLTLQIKQDGTGGRDITFPAAVKWLGTEPTWSDGGASKTIIMSMRYDGTSYWSQGTPWEQ